MNEIERALKAGKLLTDPGHPLERLKTSYGTVTYREWCEKEADRLTKAGKPSRVVSAPGKVAVARMLE